MHFDRMSSYGQGDRHYLRSFPRRWPHWSKDVKSMDATPEYMYRPEVAKRIHEFDATAKIIICLREPSSRAFSHWNMFRQIHEENFDEMWHGYMHDVDPEEKRALWELFQERRFPSFGQAISADIKAFESGSPCSEPSFVRRGIYAPQVERFIDHFGASNLLIIGSRDLRDATSYTLDRVVEFAELEPFPFNERTLEPVHARAYKSEPPRDEMAKLDRFYRPFNQQLFDLIGERPNW